MHVKYPGIQCMTVPSYYGAFGTANIPDVQ